MFTKPSDKVTFADDKLEEAFNSLNEGDWLKKAINRTIEKLKEKQAQSKDKIEELFNSLMQKVFNGELVR